MTNFIVSRNKLGDCIENPGPRELARPCNSFKGQLLLLLLLRQSALLFGLLLLLHDLPDITRDRPMTHRYVPIFASLLVNHVMLTNVRATGRISPFVKSLALAIRLNEGVIALANRAPASYLRLDLIICYLELHGDFVCHYGQEVQCCVLLYRLFLEVCSTLMVV